MPTSLYQLFCINSVNYSDLNIRTAYCFAYVLRIILKQKTEHEKEVTMDLQKRIDLQGSQLLIPAAMLCMAASILVPQQLVVAVVVAAGIPSSPIQDAMAPELVPPVKNLSASWHLPSSVYQPSSSNARQWNHNSWDWNGREARLKGGGEIGSQQQLHIYELVDFG